MTDGVCINVILLTIIICLPWDELSGVHYMCMLAIWLANDVSSSFCSIVERRKIFVCARCTLRSKPRISCVGFFFFILPFILLCGVFYFCYSSAASSSLVCRHSGAAGRGSGISNTYTIRYAICVCVLCLLCGFPPFKIHRIDRTDGRFHKMTRFAGIVHMVFIWFSAATQIKHKTKKYTPTRMLCKCITETMRNIPNTSCSEFEEYFICSHNVSV